MADKKYNLNIASIETGYSKDPRFTVFRFQVIDRPNAQPKPTEWFSIPQEGLQALMQFLTTEITRHQLSPKSDERH
jgi:hypothetical protein